MAPFLPSLSLPACRAAMPLLLGASVHLARGFAPRQPPASPDADGDAGSDEGAAAGPRRAAKSLRGKVVPCTACKGSGKKPCQFCQGTKLMVGFLGKRVPCVPCEGKATLGRPCAECGGMGYFMPK